VAAANPDAPFVEIKGTEEAGKAAYAYRVSNVRDDVPVGGATQLRTGQLQVRVRVPPIATQLRQWRHWWRHHRGDPKKLKIGNA
jgi:hypothetical protein